jgi:hypothetical protein
VAAGGGEQITLQRLTVCQGEELFWKKLKRKKNLIALFIPPK